MNNEVMQYAVRKFTTRGFNCEIIGDDIIIHTDKQGFTEANDMIIENWLLRPSWSTNSSKENYNWNNAGFGIKVYY